MKLRVHLSLETAPRQLHGSLLVWGEAAHLSDHVPHELGVPCEALAHVPGHLVALVEAHGHKAAHSCG